MKLLILSRSPLHHLIDALKFCRYAAENNAVTCVTSDRRIDMIDEAKSYSGESFTIIPVSTRGGVVARNLRYMRQCVRESWKGYDIIYLYYFPGCSLLRILIPRKLIILDIRSGCVLPGALNRALRNSLIRLEAKLFRHRAVISSGLAARLGLAGKAHIVPLGADPVDMAPKTWGSLHLLYVGTLMGRRIEDTLAGFALFLRHCPLAGTIEYTVIGDGPPGQLQKLRDLARTLGLEQTVHFKGRINHDQLHPFFESCNVGVSYVPITPFYDHQPPTKTFEYLFAGMPVIATQTCENRKIITATNGTLIKDTPGEFCRGLVDIAQNCNHWNSSAIQSSVKEYSWEAIFHFNVLPHIASLVTTNKA